MANKSFDSEFLSRTKALYGEKGIKAFNEAKVAIFGLGGVGGACFEALVRSGVRHIKAYDFDMVEPSNLNRQILYAAKDLGRIKTEVAKEKALSIDPFSEVKTYNEKVDPLFFACHDFTGYSMLIDAIDDIEAKVEIASYCLDHKIPFLISLGMANRVDPTLLRHGPLSETEGDPLAKKLRSLCRKADLDLDKIQCVYSVEKPAKGGVFLSSSMPVPVSAGLTLASLTLLSLSKKDSGEDN